MNKIFKKIWNKRRGCFVAVSEAMSSVCQGKTKAVLAASLLLVAQVPAFALVTINGDVVGKDPQFQFQGRGPALADSHTINGNLTWNLGREAGRTHQKLSNEPRYRSPFIGDLTRGTF